MEYGIKQGRLALFKPWHNDPEDWEDQWLKKSAEKILQNATSGYLGEYEIITRYLPKKQKVLEAGCGLGQVVMALSKRSYLVEGVDYAEKTIQNSREIAPELNLWVGDINHLPVTDGTYGGYISLGVLEHNPKGPAEGLNEAYRLLGSKGVACISVPFLNYGRTQRLHMLERKIAQQSDDLQFYQYYFSREEFVALLNHAGFSIQKITPFDLYDGLRVDLKWMSFLYERKFYHWRIHAWFRQLCQNAPSWTRWRWAHMAMFICQKQA
jgi:SAM-dependent methyltransferase